jgi:hypothetical protein
MRQCKFIALGILLSATFASAQTGTSTAVAPGTQTAVTPGAPTAVTGTPTAVRGEALISGVAVDADLVAIAHAPVRLRNLDTRAVEQTKSANSVGEFTFAVRPAVPYVVEIVDSKGRILAVTDVVVAQPGEVAAAIITIAAKIPGAAGLFSDSLGSVISAAAGMGVTAVETTVRPFVSPER